MSLTSESVPTPPDGSTLLPAVAALAGTAATENVSPVSGSVTYRPETVVVPSLFSLMLS